jgi:hypothetical protein
MPDPVAGNTYHGDPIVARTKPIALEPDGPDVVYGRRQFPGSVDLLHAATLPEWATQGARICDVSRTIDAACGSILEATAEFIAKKLGAIKKKIAAADARSDRLESENISLRSEIVEIRGELADLKCRFKASRGVGDGAQLPASIVKPRRRAATKRKPSVDATGSAEARQ